MCLQRIELCKKGYIYGNSNRYNFIGTAEVNVGRASPKFQKLN